MNEVSVLGIAFDEANEMAAVILTMEGAKKVVPIPIDIQEGITVIRLLQKRKMPRPMTHDLMYNIIGDLHHRVQKIEIDFSDAGQYVASVLVKGGDDLPPEPVEAEKEKISDKFISLDARPFDAIAIAIKSEAPMFMSENAYDTNSVPLVMEQKTGEKDDEFKDFVQNLKASDFNRVERLAADPEEEPEGDPEEDDETEEER
jgi:bifunctional DNase/RNase